MKPKLILALLTVMVASGCGGQQPTEPAGPAPAALPEGKAYVSTKVTEGGDNLTLPAELRLEFTKDGITADAGCNHLFGKASLDAGRLAVTDLGGTEMACEKPLMDQEKWFSEFLTRSPVIVVDGTKLVLSGGRRQIELQEEKQTATPLQGTAWKLDSLVDGETASSLPNGVKADLKLGKDGKVTGNAGCNSFGGTYTTKGDTITFGSLGLTRMACGGEKDTVEKAVVAVLDGAVTYRVEGKTLTLTHASGKGLQFTAG